MGHRISKKLGSNGFSCLGKGSSDIKLDFISEEEIADYKIKQYIADRYYSTLSSIKVIPSVKNMPTGPRRKRISNTIYWELCDEKDRDDEEIESIFCKKFMSDIEKQCHIAYLERNPDILNNEDSSHKRVLNAKAAERLEHIIGKEVHTMMNRLIKKYVQRLVSFQCFIGDLFLHLDVIIGSVGTNKNIRSKCDESDREDFPGLNGCLFYIADVYAINFEKMGYTKLHSTVRQVLSNCCSEREKLLVAPLMVSLSQLINKRKRVWMYPLNESCFQVSSDITQYRLLLRKILSDGETFSS